MSWANTIRAQRRSWLLAVAVGAASCGDDEPSGGGSSSTTFTPLTDGSATTRGGATTGRADTTSGVTVTSSSTTAAASSSSSTGEESSATQPACSAPMTTGAAETGGGDYVFAEIDYCDYVQVDRIGMPLVTSLLVDDQDAYNAAAPGRNAFGFFPEMHASIDAMHDTLDADLQSSGFTPCDLATCIEQMVTEYLAFDTLRLSTDAAQAFPNGRTLDAPILDLVLALVLLDLGTHDIDTFAQVPLGPTQNDLMSADAWPFVREPHL